MKIVDPGLVFEEQPRAKFIVSGAGTALVNGTYVFDGSRNNHDAYRQVDGNYTLHYDGSNHWRLGVDYACCSSSYWWKGSATHPPSGGWKVGLDSAPAPTVCQDKSGGGITTGDDSYVEEQLGI